MDQAVLDFAVARAMMVDGQIRPNKVTDPRIIAAMRSVARERFLPPALASLAYVDIEVELGAGRVLPQPMVTARLLQLAELRDADRVLVVGAGPGYSAALLVACGGVVTALDTAPGIASVGVDWVAGPLEAGWAAGGPYDLILIDGGAAEFPASFAAQLAPNGRLVGVQVSGGTGRAVRGTVADGSMRLVPMFDCNATVLPGLAQVAGFVF
jgi:protein-L-isoaspartate(D-aspartate) O-methyltransferase